MHHVIMISFRHLRGTVYCHIKSYEYQDYIMYSRSILTYSSYVIPFRSIPLSSDDLHIQFDRNCHHAVSTVVSSNPLRSWYCFLT